ncbi:hypothetical protein DFH94DRAFT_82825 [Russula ochroleuca]|jgi:hypothetical protein|uniref:Uncharacterized protein n=1 Tax=Russula ochroleuca TaxID=152965 RepID=A0A9P5T773_9AGAM|nr:hypothetical protein DFH94DRAFT_82825 [Russula ochroleuca]
MGGKAFLSHLPNATFPCLSPVVCDSLKSGLLRRLTPLSQYVGIPRSPGEERPLECRLLWSPVKCPPTAVRHEEIKECLVRAPASRAQPEAGRTHNFALGVAMVN